MNDLELEREIRATFGRRGVDVLDPELIPPAREVIRQTRRRQIATVLTGVVIAGAVAVASVAGTVALLRASERKIPAEPPDTLPVGSLEAAAAQPVSYSGLVADTDGNLWSITPALTRFEPATGTFRTFTIADDPAFSASSVVPARDGGVWVTSAWYSGGAPMVRRFDATSFVEALPPAPASLSELAEAPDGTIWASGDRVLSWDGASWIEAPSEGRPTDFAGPIAVDTAGNVWVGNLGYPGPDWSGVSRFDGSSWTTFSGEDLFGDLGGGPDAGAIWTIVPGPAGDVWVGGSGSVTHFVDGSWTPYRSRDLGLRNVMSVAVTEDAVWVGGQAAGPPAIARFDGTTWAPLVDGLEGDGGTEYTDVVTSAQGTWVRTNIGLYRLEGERWQPITTDERPSDVMPPVAGAGADEVWTGDWTALGGLWRMQGNRWTHHDLSEAEIDGGVRALLVTADGTVWTATDRALAMFDGEDWREVASGGHTALALAPSGEVWAANSGGADGAVVGPVGEAELPGPVPVEGDVTSLAIDPAGEVWVGSGGIMGMGGGVARFDGEGWVKAQPVTDAVDLLVQDIAVAPDGDVWVTATIPPDDTAALDPGTPVLARYHDGTWTTFAEADGVPPDETGWSRELEVTSDGRLLLATLVGLFEFRDGTWVQVEEGMFFSQTPWGHTFSIAPDGTIWLAGDGLFRIPAQP